MIHWPKPDSFLLNYIFEFICVHLDTLNFFFFGACDLECQRINNQFESPRSNHLQSEVLRLRHQALDSYISADGKSFTEWQVRWTY